jgi:hypothetical protein
MRFLLIIAYFVLFTSINASDISMLAKSLNLYPGTKASVQWERIFSSERKQKKYSIDTLTKQQKEDLRAYLVQYAADSDQPIVPGL